MEKVKMIFLHCRCIQRSGTGERNWAPALRVCLDNGCGLDLQDLVEFRNIEIVDTVGIEIRVVPNFGDGIDAKLEFLAVLQESVIG